MAIAPSNPEEVRFFDARVALPFPCLGDPDREVFRRYGVGASLWSLGQRPAVFLIGPDGEIRRSWHGRQQWEIPSIEDILVAISE